VPANFVNQNTLDVILQRSQEIVSGPPILKNVEGKKELLDDPDPELMAKIIAEVTKKLRGLGSRKDEQENKLFDIVVKWNPRTYDGKEDPVLLEEWVRKMKKIFGILEVLDNRRVNIGAFYLTRYANIWWGMVKPTFQNSETTWSKFNEALCIAFIEAKTNGVLNPATG